MILRSPALEFKFKLKRAEGVRVQHIFLMCVLSPNVAFAHHIATINTILFTVLRLFAVSTAAYRRKKQSSGRTPHPTSYSTAPFRPTCSLCSSPSSWSSTDIEFTPDLVQGIPVWPPVSDTVRGVWRSYTLQRKRATRLYTYTLINVRTSKATVQSLRYPYPSKYTVYAAARTQLGAGSVTTSFCCFCGWYADCSSAPGTQVQASNLRLSSRTFSSFSSTQSVCLF